jgi:hypothetical protein
MASHTDRGRRISETSKRGRKPLSGRVFRAAGTIGGADATTDASHEKTAWHEPVYSLFGRLIWINTSDASAR